MIKANKILKIITAAAIAVASIIMIVFAIINLIPGGPKQPETIAFQIIASIILSSIISTILVIAKDPHHFDARLVVYNGILLGTGIFVVLDAARGIANTLVGYFLPAILVGVGAFFIIATIVSIVNKVNSKNTNIIAMVLGIVMLVIGILLLCFADRGAISVTWLIIGILLLTYSIFAIVAVIKGKDVKPIDFGQEE